MFHSNHSSSPDASLSREELQMLDRINAYAEKVLGDIDPQKTRISYQLEKLKPVMEEIAAWSTTLMSLRVPLCIRATGAALGWSWMPIRLFGMKYNGKQALSC